MCHEKEGAPSVKFKKATVLDMDGYFYNPVKAVLTAEKGMVIVYGNPKMVPNGAIRLRANAVYDNKGKQVL